MSSSTEELKLIKNQIKFLFELISAQKKGFELEWRLKKILELLEELKKIDNSAIDVQIIAVSILYQMKLNWL